MIILSIRTDNPEAEIGLYKDGEQTAYESWQAHRQLAETLHLKIRDLLVNQQLSLTNLQGIVCYKGPGSFTGLRIGLTVGNALSYALGVPIVATTGDDWQADGIGRLNKHENDKIAMPEYGAGVHVTLPKK